MNVQEYLEQNNKLNQSVIQSVIQSTPISISIPPNNINQSNSDNKIIEIEDAWERSINNVKFYTNNRIMRIFPTLKNVNNFSKLKIDDESFSYITIREIADLTSKIICKHLLNFNINPQKITIIDYTAGIGGNILSFCKYFKYVYGLEVSQLRTEYLINNIDVYEFKNFTGINTCAIEFNENHMIDINPHVIFIDPPWGGTNYKSNVNLKLKLGSMNLEDLIINICNKFSNYYNQPSNANSNFKNKLIVLKLPKNYNIEDLYNIIKSSNNCNNHNDYNINLHLYVLNKMLIVICELCYCKFSI